MTGRRTASRLVAAALGAALGSGCGTGESVELRRATSEGVPGVGTSADGSASAGDDAGGAMASDADAGVTLLGPPLPFAPTAEGFAINAVVGTGDPSLLRGRVRALGTAVWRAAQMPTTPADDVAEWRFDELLPGTRHEYEIRANGVSLYRGEVVTRREPGTAFTFSLLTDTHVWPREVEPGDTSLADFMEETLFEVAIDLAEDAPDFLVDLGDALDFHEFGFNEPPPESRHTKLAYLNYRRLLGDALGNAPIFHVIGNWEGENGDYTPEEIDRSRSQRLLYVPGPTPETYPQGGGEHEDYYAFTWGDALFVVLNVMTYTPTAHRLSNEPGLPDDWTLGDAQLAWLRTTLEEAEAKWRFLFIHHAVGGAAGDADNSAYGRGGGRAATVGEQAIVHELMRAHGVQIFFYGHDHVFTDMVVDGIHYTLPGSAGAPWKFITEETGYTDYWPDSGHGRVHVAPDRVEVEFVALGGEVIHRYEIQ